MFTAVRWTRSAYQVEPILEHVRPDRHGFEGGAWPLPPLDRHEARRADDSGSQVEVEHHEWKGDAALFLSERGRDVGLHRRQRVGDEGERVGRARRIGGAEERIRVVGQERL